LVVPESEHAKSPGFELTIATLVVSMLFLVLSAIELNDKFCLKACEVGNIAGDRRLSPESKPSKLPTT
jgi:hypothetical protein